MNNARPDYFQPASEVETILRRIKGNYRRDMIVNALAQEDISAIPQNWLSHDLSKALKNVLQVENPRFRGGEDLANLEEGEVEIARVSLVDSVHGEVISLRAHCAGEGHPILLSIVDEYGEDYTLEQEAFPGPLTAEEVLRVFRNSKPCASLSSCRQRFSSDFYPKLDELADQLGIKKDWED